MPGYILHLTAAQMFLKQTKKEQELFVNKQETNNFLIGNLMPDTTKDKARSHFRDPKYQGNMVEYPEISWFARKYHNILHDPSVMGYLFHLYIDRKFFKEYMPRIIEFRDKEDRVEEKMSKVKYVILKRTGEKILKEDFFSEKYYYGDYTKMNTYLFNHYHIPIRLDPEVNNPGIEEVSYRNVKNVLKELEGYLTVPEEAVKNVKVFDVEELLSFLENSVEKYTPWNCE